MTATAEERLNRARIALEGLSVGDALGGFFEFAQYIPTEKLAERVQALMNLSLWRYTDDTNMALSIYGLLRQDQAIDQDKLMADFALRFESGRGYGMGAHHLLKQVGMGGDWRILTPAMFNGTGSYGNGAAMRIAPLGAYFADDLEMAIEQVRLSSEVTHSHAEGIAGGIAVAVATAQAWRFRQTGERPNRQAFIALVLPFIPDSIVKQQCQLAHNLPEDCSLALAVHGLGNGSAVSAQDSVPLVLWLAGGYLDDYEKAILTSISAGGDVDTTAAMVGGIVATYLGHEAIPAAWLQRREPLPTWAVGD